MQGVERALKPLRAPLEERRNLRDFHVSAGLTHEISHVLEIGWAATSQGKVPKLGQLSKAKTEGTEVPRPRIGVDHYHTPAALYYREIQGQSGAYACWEQRPLTSIFKNFLVRRCVERSRLSRGAGRPKVQEGEGASNIRASRKQSSYDEGAIHTAGIMKIMSLPHATRTSCHKDGMRGRVRCTSE